ncbi:hypothetical protein WA026_017551 [Henosepilachna vigintioctopunctata]|uniref:Fibronectin type-III domain-containing protein n=1 Tax=Henosepilachna vigintioctopunctata TaxID=420089 RepID=A0AAW1UUV9_9CUCU
MFTNVNCKLFLVFSQVEAEPTAKLFRWSFNSTPGISRELTEFSSDEGGSVLTYVPKIAADYGTLQCWGQNDIGAQQQPCTYHIVPAGKPDPPHTCQLTNVTHHSVVLSCKKGFDGGLKQRFIMVLTSSDTLVANMSSTTLPDFRLTNLEPAQEYSITVSSFNSKGWSKNGDSIIFRTLPAPGLNEQRRLMEASRGEHNRTGPWLYITLAAGSTLIIAGTVGVIIFAVRRFRNENETKIVTDVKLLDWQACYFGSPVLDLSYALYSGCSKETLDKFPDLLKIYHDTLLLSLSKLGCQSSRPYPFEIFKEEWPRFCQFGVILGILVTKIKLTDMAVLPDPADVDTKDNSNYFEELVLAKEECDVPELLKRIDYIFEHLRKIGVFHE